MSDFPSLETNVTRVERMLDTLALLEKSAKSQRATTSEWSELLEPLTSLIAEKVTANDPPEQDLSGARQQRLQPRTDERVAYGDDLRSIIESAELQTCLSALTQLSARIDELVHEKETPQW